MAPRQRLIWLVLCGLLAAAAPALAAGDSNGPARLRVPAGCRALPGTVAEPYGQTGWAKEIVHEATGIEFVYIPAGIFRPAAAALGGAADASRPDVELPQGFYLGKYEVTQAQWRKVMGSTPSAFRVVPGRSGPVEQVSWEDCLEFCERLNPGAAGGRSAAKPFRLPTEAEWEYACRAGTTSLFSFGDRDSGLWQYGNYCDQANTNGFEWQDRTRRDGFDKTAPVGRLKPNAWGLYDMHGNVAEWCHDAPREGAPIVRGGSWVDAAERCRSASRRQSAPGSRYSYVGCRVVRVAELP